MVYLKGWKKNSAAQYREEGRVHWEMLGRDRQTELCESGKESEAYFTMRFYRVARKKEQRFSASFTISYSTECFAAKCEVP